MQDIYNPENFTPYLYHAPENSGTGLPFIIRASRMGCGYEESFFCVQRNADYPDVYKRQSLSRVGSGGRKRNS